ncbi:hypothetical protein COOONC_10441 [Cooperia oncophora]
MRKSFDAKRFIHEGAVTKVPDIVEKRPPPQDLSADTLKALDWILQNITKVTEGEESYKKALTLNSDTDDADGKGFPVPLQLFASSDNTDIVKPFRGKSARKNSKEVRYWNCHASDTGDTFCFGLTTETVPSLPRFKKLRKGKSKQRKGSRKAHDLELHSGEFKPYVRTKKMDAMNSVERKVMEAEDYAAPFDSGVIHNGLSIPKSVEYTDETAPIADRGSSSVESTAYRSLSPPQNEQRQAKDLNLVPIRRGFLPGANAEFHQQPMHVITEGSTDHEGR